MPIFGSKIKDAIAGTPRTLKILNIYLERTIYITHIIIYLV